MALTHHVKFLPSYDRRTTTPGHNYGICGVRMFLWVRGPKGAVVCSIHTGWYLPELIAERTGKVMTCTGDRVLDSMCLSYVVMLGDKPESPSGSDLSVHRKCRKTRKGAERCEYVDGWCYCKDEESQSLPAYLVLKRLVCEGDAGLWDELESRYNKAFEVKS